MSGGGKRGAGGRRRGTPAGDAPSPARALRGTGGTPIEEAPPWVLAIFTAILWLICFPAVVGLLAGWGHWHGNRLAAAAAAFVVAVLLLAAVAFRKPWRRRPDAQGRVQRPLLVRLSTWVITALFLPNILFGVLVLTHEGPPLTYQQSWLLGGLISAVQGALAWLERRKLRRAGQSAPPE